MNIARFFVPVAAFVAAGAMTLGSTPAASPAEGIQAGETPSFSWRNAPIGSMGKTSLEDLRGTPVLVEFWGTR